MCPCHLVHSSNFSSRASTLILTSSAAQLRTLSANCDDDGSSKIPSRRGYDTLCAVYYNERQRSNSTTGRCGYPTLLGPGPDEDGRTLFSGKGTLRGTCPQKQRAAVHVE